MMELKLNVDEKVRERISQNYLNALVNPKIPGSFNRGDRINSKPKYIVIHDSSCLNNIESALITDSEQIGVGALKIASIRKLGLDDYNFHFIVDKIGEDYEVVAGRPMTVKCDFPDLDPVYQNSLHVIILCDLNIDMPNNRLYKVLSYRCLAPLLKMLKISSDPYKAIVFHRDVETKRKDLKCPGDFLAKEVLMAQVRRYM